MDQQKALALIVEHRGVSASAESSTPTEPTEAMKSAANEMATLHALGVNVGAATAFPVVALFQLIMALMPIFENDLPTIMALIKKAFPNAF